MGISAKEAAELVGMTKQGIIRAINRGKLSATKDINNEWSIEPVELFRIYTPKQTSMPVDTNVDSNSLQDKIAMLERMLNDKDDVIRDLRTRLDDEADERRKLTMMLTAQNEKPKTVNLWQRLFGSQTRQVSQVETIYII